MPDLCGGVGDQEVELLVPEGSLVAAPPAGGVILAAAHDLGPQAQAAVGVTLPRETPHPQAACLYKIHLYQKCRGSATVPAFTADLRCHTGFKGPAKSPKETLTPSLLLQRYDTAWRSGKGGSVHTCC